MMHVRCQVGDGIGRFQALTAITIFVFLWANLTPMHLTLSLGN